MAAAAPKAQGKLSQILTFLLPKSVKGGGKPLAFTDTFNPGLVGNLLGVPTYTEHMDDIATDRGTLNSKDLIQKLFKTDPDVSATVHAYLTVSNTEMLIDVRDPQGDSDVDGHTVCEQAITTLTNRVDYTKGFQLIDNLGIINTRMRTLILMRGAIGAELLFDKTLNASQVNLVDAATIFWEENSIGVFSPIQRPAATGQLIPLDIPNFFYSRFRQDPTGIYPYSPFVSAINTIAARQQVVNDLYRIMTISGYSRVTLKVLEEVALKNAPNDVRSDDNKKRAYINTLLGDVAQKFASLRADQPFAYTDSIEPSMLNEKNPGMQMDISPIINVLNGQNQAALKTMATIIGRGESGVNTASVEARIFCMSADALNDPIANIWSQILNFVLRVHGSQSVCTVTFRPSELRPATELEPQLVIKAARLKEDLSLGVISDEEYTIAMYGRLPLPGAPPLSGTGFMQQTAPGLVDPAVGAAAAGGGSSGQPTPLDRSAKAPGTPAGRTKAAKKAA